ncbi:glycosyltransferase family 4 protein [Streptomyces sp. NPDC057638]|uniref:glycosyltransferase family 4 protein n=1 Tax=Streptomyces sp. NPDC057638 TaxID=3346190 RepID=UPI0036764B4F
MKISFLIHTVYGIGGTIRTTLNLAGELADRHEIEIVSVFRHRDEPLFAIDPRITVVPLIDTRPGAPTSELDHPRHRRPAEVFPAAEPRHGEYSLLADERVRDHYAASGADVVVGTRAGLIAYAVAFAPEGAVVVGQEHGSHDYHKPALRALMLPYLRRLDAFVTVSQGDATVYRERVELPGRILAIPNSVPEPLLPLSDTSGTIVMAAGRLSGEKRYDVLIDAFARVAAARPEWTLRIYGWGPEKERLRRRIDALGLHEHIQLMGPRAPIEPEWVKAAIAVSTSSHESFGMSLVEAMRCGLPVVSTDCDHGPREIVGDGVDGLLVPVGEVEAIARALLRLVDDSELRRAMGSAAARNARRFDPGPIAKRYEELFTRLLAGRGGGARGPAPVVAAGERGPWADVVVGDDGTVSVTLLGRPVPGARLICSHPHPEVADRSFPLSPTARVPLSAGLEEGVWTCGVALDGAGAPVREGRGDPGEGQAVRDGKAEPVRESQADPVPDGRADPVPDPPSGPGGGPASAGAPLPTRVIDQRGALRAGSRPYPAGVRHLVPYRKGGTLLLRSWARAAHAEVGPVRAGEREITVDGRLLGVPGGLGVPGVAGVLAALGVLGAPSAVAAAGGAPTLSLRRRGPEPVALEYPVAWVGAPGDRFRATIPVGGPVGVWGGGHEVWDLWLRYAPGAAPARLGRILDDVVEKGSLFPYPTVRVGAEGTRARLGERVRRLLRRPSRRPGLTLFYSAANDLVLTVTGPSGAV